ncbi:MAG TPA: 16S rRNA (uracil(1498)-N(3))-methyltransferase [Candidatus Dormibacteraeota bacterium]|nr:16S rRNA (uracil(1498)-N(3))-methyltransferase [Candidatus Dormibacteraeota bacterium]
MFWTFVEASEVARGRVSIGGPQGHHLARVLRVRPGECGVAVSNGREYEIEVVEVDGTRVVGRVVGDRPVQGEPGIGITLLQAVVPNPDFDAVIEAGTAVGIRRFIAVHAERSVARPAASRLTRWQAIAGSAAEQSHRGAMPEVAGPVSLPSALEQARGTRLLVLEPSASAPLLRAIDGSNAYTIAVGPEGGWTDGELSLMSERDGIFVNLGPRILRARLAAVVAAAILVQQP